MEPRSFSAVSAVTQTEPGRFLAEVDPEWSIGGKPNGGYLLSMLGRAATSMSPVQYQKQIRLQRARIRLLANPGDVAGAGHAVGYTSASQFNREYRRMFGAPPGLDAARLHTANIVAE